MPRTTNSKGPSRLRYGGMKLSRKNVSPTFQPYWLARLAADDAAPQVLAEGLHLVGGDLELGVHGEVGLVLDRQVGEELAEVGLPGVLRRASPFTSRLAASDPPNQLEMATRLTPGTWAIWPS